MRKIITIIFFIVFVWCYPGLCAVTQSAPVVLTPSLSSPYGQYNPKGAYNNAGIFLLVWEQGVNIGTEAHSTVYGARVQLNSNGTLTVLDPGGFQITSSTNTQMAPKAVYGGGVFFVVWQELVAGQFQIYAARVNSSGTVLDAAGFPICTRAYNQIEPDLTYDYINNQFFVVWADYSAVLVTSYSSGYQIFGARVSGNTILDSAGVLIGSESQFYYSFSPVVGFNGADFLVSWQKKGSPLDTNQGANFNAYLRICSFPPGWSSGPNITTILNDTNYPNLSMGAPGKNGRILVNGSGDFCLLTHYVDVERNYTAYKAAFHRITASGSLVNELTPTIIDPWNKSIAYDGAWIAASNEFMTVWEGGSAATQSGGNDATNLAVNPLRRIYGVRVSAQPDVGGVVDTTPVTLGDTTSDGGAGNSYAPAIAAGFSDYALLAFEYDNESATSPSHVIKVAVLNTGD